MNDGDKCWVWHEGSVVEATFRGPLTYLIELPDGKQTNRLMAAICRDESERDAFLRWHERQKANNEDVGRGTAAGTRTHQPLVGGLNQEEKR